MKIANPTLEYEKKLLIDIRKLRSLLQELKFDDFEEIEELSATDLAKKVIRGSHIKRLNERWHADPNFQQEFLADPYQAILNYNLDINSKDIQALWNDLHAQKDAIESDSLPLESGKDFSRQIKSDMCQNIAGSSRDLRFRAWRERQIARTSSQMRKSVHDNIAHMTAAFELSKGCSVGCWFCAISAPRLGDIFTYTEENAQLWGEVLKLLKNIHGEASKAGFCYWASDPLDNPDYEQFCLDFYEILETFPVTTTALALRNPERTRKLLKLSLDKGCLYNRFSILSLKILDQLYQEFTPEELAFVNLVLQNPESDSIKSNSGRARDRNQKKAEKNQETFNDDDALQGTSSCVSGFLFNMVDRTVKLISPYNASDRYPLGYRIFEEGTFTNAEDLKILLESMIDRHMPLTVRPNDLVRFRQDLNYESLADGFQVSTRFKTHTFRSAPYVKQVGEMIHKGNMTAQEIAESFKFYGIPSIYIFQALNLMFKDGVLDDEI
ncbi:MAG: radical SAM family RiPP maturation amino acid epimerase [Xenococcaceae cyanobacterium MO_188.B32]|nr:radical SAM family RiPP maturation amino acid epimerase [Xenococcaceae cyanobacterium MO_188.B32]